MSKQIELKVYHLSKRYQNQVVFSNLNFSSKPGVWGIGGSNGSGKSTLLKCLSYLLKPSQGQIYWYHDQKQVEAKQLRDILGYVAPYVNLYDELSCHENLKLLGHLRGLENLDNRIVTMLTELGAAELQHKTYGRLSTGQQQRLKLASALLHDPPIIILDEPGSNLDQSGQDYITQLIDKVLTQKNRLVLLASNQESELQQCEEVYRLD